LLNESLATLPLTGDVLLIGLTESGIVPSFLMYLEACRLTVPCRWICSTRRPCSSGIAFQETHSHSPNHTLPIPRRRFAEIWIIEDEITTGSTVKNLLRQLKDHVPAEIFRIFSLVDFRSEKQKEEFFHPPNENKKAYLFHTAVSLAETEGDALERVNNSESQNPLAACYPEAVLQKSATECGLSSHRIPVNGYADGTLFVIGEAVRTAAHFVAAGTCKSFQHITLSPWLVDDVSIKSRISLHKDHYLYNEQESQGLVYLLHDPTDYAIGETIQKQLREQGIPVEQLTLS
jgi:hypothetical protein